MKVGYGRFMRRDPVIDYYEILEISPNASQEVLKKAYLLLVQKYQPELYNVAYKRYATERLKSIQEAYGVLSDSAERRRYDAMLGQATRLSLLAGQEKMPAIPKQSHLSLRQTVMMLMVCFLIFYWFKPTLMALPFPAILGVLFPVSLIVMVYGVLKFRNTRQKRRS